MTYRQSSLPWNKSFTGVLNRWEKSLLLLNNTDVQKVLDMSLCMAALDEVFQEMARGEAVGMGRIDVYVPSGQKAAPYYRWAVMTGGSKKDGLVCARMLSDMVACHASTAAFARTNTHARRARSWAFFFCSAPRTRRRSR